MFSILSSPILIFEEAEIKSYVLVLSVSVFLWELQICNIENFIWLSVFVNDLGNISEIQRCYKGQSQRETECNHLVTKDNANNLITRHILFGKQFRAVQLKIVVPLPFLLEINWNLCTIISNVYRKLSKNHWSRTKPGPTQADIAFGNYLDEFLTIFLNRSEQDFYALSVVSKGRKIEIAISKRIV